MGKGSIPAQSTYRMASIQISHGEGGWEKFDTFAARCSKIK